MSHRNPVSHLPAWVHIIRVMTEPWHPESSTEIGRDIYCPACRYSLYKAPADKCPECGYSLDSLRDGICRIPWIQRQQNGRNRTYWKTVGLVVFHPTLFSEEYASSISVRDARLYRWVTILLAYLPIVTIAFIIYLDTPVVSEVGNPVQQMMATGFIQPAPTIVDRAFAEGWLHVVFYLCVLLFLYLSTELPSHLLHARSIAPQQQANAVAMSYYCCASLVFVPAVFLALQIAIAVFYSVTGLNHTGSTGMRCITVTLLAVGGCSLGYWSSLRGLARRTMPQLRKRTALVTIGLPILWFGLALLVLGLLPLAVLFVLAVVVSLGG